MPELTLLLRPKEPLLLPAAHHELLQGLFYRLLAEADPALSERIHGGADKCYCFTDLQGDRRTLGERILYPGAVRWSFRSADPSLTEALRRRIEEKPEVQLARVNCAAAELSLTERRFFTERLMLTAVTPLLAYHTAEVRAFHSPEEEEFYTTIENGLLRRFQAFAGQAPAGEVRLLPVDAEERRDRCVTSFKGSYLRGYYGKYLLIGSAEALTFAYHAGLGSKTSAGFGTVTPAEE